MDRIVEEHQMAELIENFMMSGKKSFVVGAPIGTYLEHIILTVATRFCSLDKIMIIDSIRDYTLLTNTTNENIMKKNPAYIPPVSRVHYTTFGDYRPTTNSLEGNMILAGRQGYENRFLCNKLMQYKHFAIILDAHTIPKSELDKLVDALDCKVLIVVDPYDIGGELYMNIPIIHETYCHMSPHVIFTRKLYGIKSSYGLLSKKYDYKIEKIKSLTRSIGSQPKFTYVSNSPGLIEQIDSRQRLARPAKNHRFVVDDCRYRELYPGLISDKDTLITVDKIDIHGHTEFKVWNDSKPFTHPYVVHPVSSEVPIILKPADLITPEMCTHHRFKTICLVMDKNVSISKKELYSIFKSCREIVVMEYK